MFSIVGFFVFVYVDLFYSGVAFGSRDVLQDDNIREGIKQFS
jgi:glutaredoxin-related protein